MFTDKPINIFILLKYRLGLQCKEDPWLHGVCKQKATLHLRGMFTFNAFSNLIFLILEQHVSPLFAFFFSLQSGCYNPLKPLI